MKLILSFKKVFSVFRLAPFETDTSSGRSKERYRRAFLTASVSSVSKGLAIIINIVTVPLVLHYLGREEYGLWLTISSVITWLSISDFGLSSGLSNKLTEAVAMKDLIEARKLVSTAFWTLAGISGILFITYFAFSQNIAWDVFFNVQGIVPTKQVYWVTTVVFINIILMFPLNIVSVVYQAYQEGFINQIWSSVGSIFNLLAIIIVTSMKGGLILVAIAISFWGIFVTVINALFLFIKFKPEIFPVLKDWSLSCLKRIWKLSGSFFLLSICGLVVNQMGYFIIIRILGPGEVTPYGVIMRLLTAAQGIVLIIQTPFWPAFAEAQVKGDKTWIKKTFFRSLAVSVTFMAFTAVILLVFGRSLIVCWAGKDALPGTNLLSAAAFQMVLSGIFICLSVLLYGLSVIKEQLILAATNAVVTFFAMIVLGNLMGGAGIIWSNFLGGLSIALPMMQLAKKKLNFKYSNFNSHSSYLIDNTQTRT